MFKNSISKARSLIAKGAVILSPAVILTSAHAADPDYSTITGAIDWTSVGVGILAIGAAVAGVYVIQKGVQLILAGLKRA